MGILAFAELTPHQTPPDFFSLLLASTEFIMFDKLTDELLIETLIRLPLKPANICKCLSKRFRSVISSSYFISCYVKHHQVGNSVAVYYNFRIKMSNPRFKDLYFPETLIAFGSPIFEFPQPSLSLALSVQLKQHALRHLASNNGLVLCCEYRVSQGCPIVYFVCNPLTKQCVALPPPPSNVKAVYVGFICKTQYSCDDDHQDESEMGSKTSFKVVRLEAKSHTQLATTIKLEIFCSVSWRWTEDCYMSSAASDHELFYKLNKETHCAVVCDGLLHWDALSNRGIFTYDPCNGECTTIKLPPHVRREQEWMPFRLCLGECCGRLRYANISLDDKNCRVWELKDYGIGGEWLLLHKVHWDEVKSCDQTINKSRMHLLFPHLLNQDIVFFWCFSSSQIVEYNMGDRLLRDAYRSTHYTNAYIPFVDPCWPIPFVIPCWPTAVPELNSTSRWPWKAAMWRGVSSKRLKPANQILSSMSSSS